MTRTIRIFTAVIALAAAAAGCSREGLNALAPTAAGDELAILDLDANVVADLSPQVDPGAYGRVDRMGMPAVATALIQSKDAYNAADPADDAAGAFVPEIVSSLETLHGALDDDLASLGLTPCATGDCVAQAAPFVVPDRIHIDVTRPPGFPNGRRLSDPAIDVTLALALLDLGAHPVTTLVGVNPTRNDRPFSPTFPYLAPPHAAAER